MQSVSPQSSIDEFQKIFGHAPQFIVTAPGRVNLIGEHTDYNLLPVLPMALDRAISIFLSRRHDATVRLVNQNPTYPSIELSLDQPISPMPGHWANYCLAALHYLTTTNSNEANPNHVQPALSENPLSTQNDHVTTAESQTSTHHDGGYTPSGFNALITSTLPPAAGLSSSSALVIATCLAFLQANNIQWTPLQVAEEMRKAEHFVGTAGGGMDQAAIALGQSDSALLIEFDPLHPTPVAIPQDITVFIINSGQKAEKSGAARYNYNRRALECALGVELLNQHLEKMATLSPSQTPTLEQTFPGSAGIPAGHNANSTTAPELHTSPVSTSLRDIYYLTTHASPATSPLPHVRAAHSSHTAVSTAAIPPDPITPDQLKSIITPERFAQLCREKKLDPDATSEWLPNNLLQIYPRVAHVLNEADRVYALRDAFSRNDRTSAFLISNAGHASCRDLYHISTPEIETLIQKTLAAGAGSARITGAGFGGCIVALVPTENADTFPQNLINAGIPAENIIKAKSQGPARIQSAD